MHKNLCVTKTIEINAEVAKVWDALTKPELIKRYLFGTETITDWQVGSEIIFQGTWEGKPYRDKGEIVKVSPKETLQYTYWSGFSGLEDKKENYSLLTYNLQEKDGATVLSFTQEGFANEQARNHSDKSWDMVLDKMKGLLEGRP
jgi:uncharacterized protein YndB with AHSA1/START domain